MNSASVILIAISIHNLEAQAIWQPTKLITYPMQDLALDGS